LTGWHHGLTGPPLQIKAPISEPQTFAVKNHHWHRRGWSAGYFDSTTIKGCFPWDFAEFWLTFFSIRNGMKGAREILDNYFSKSQVKTPQFSGVLAAKISANLFSSTAYLSVSKSATSGKAEA
jgi:hypothetical protein